MRIRWMTPIALLIIVLGVSCSSDSSSNGGVGPAFKTVENPFQLHIGESVTIESENLEVAFETFYGDSRCPSDVVCFWEGQAEIGLRVIDGVSGDTSHVPLIIRPGRDPLNHYKDTLGLRFDFLEFDPYPISTVRIPDSERVATVAVFRNSPKDAIDGTVSITNWAPAGFEIDAFDLDTASVDDDVLTLTVGYSGGCEDHNFDLYMSPMGFAKSAPVQADIYLAHNANGDACEAYLNKSLRFDLRPIAQMEQIYFGQTDCIMLNVYAYDGQSVSTNPVRVLYRPSNGVPTSWCNSDAE